MEGKSMPIVKLTQKHLSYNAGELVTLSDADAAKWCGDIDPRFRVAVRVPDDQLPPQLRKQAQAPMNRMVGVPDVAKGTDTGPGGTMPRAPRAHDEEKTEEEGTPAGQRPLRRDEDKEPETGTGPQRGQRR